MAIQGTATVRKGHVKRIYGRHPREAYPNSWIDVFRYEEILVKFQTDDLTGAAAQELILHFNWKGIDEDDPKQTEGADQRRKYRTTKVFCPQTPNDPEHYFELRVLDRFEMTEKGAGSGLGTQNQGVTWSFVNQLEDDDPTPEARDEINIQIGFSQLVDPGPGANQDPFTNQILLKDYGDEMDWRDYSRFLIGGYGAYGVNYVNTVLIREIHLRRSSDPISGKVGQTIRFKLNNDPLYVDALNGVGCNADQTPVRLDPLQGIVNIHWGAGKVFLLRVDEVPILTNNIAIISYVPENPHAYGPENAPTRPPGNSPYECFFDYGGGYGRTADTTVVARANTPLVTPTLNSNHPVSLLPPGATPRWGYPDRLPMYLTYWGSNPYEPDDDYKNGAGSAYFSGSGEVQVHDAQFAWIDQGFGAFAWGGNDAGAAQFQAENAGNSSYQGIPTASQRHNIYPFTNWTGQSRQINTGIDECAGGYPATGFYGQAFCGVGQGFFYTTPDTGFRYHVVPFSSHHGAFNAITPYDENWFYAQGNSIADIGENDDVSLGDVVSNFDMAYATDACNETPQKPLPGGQGTDPGQSIRLSSTDIMTFKSYHVPPLSSYGTTARLTLKIYDIGTVFLVNPDYTIDAISDAYGGPPNLWYSGTRDIPAPETNGEATDPVFFNSFGFL